MTPTLMRRVMFPLLVLSALLPVVVLIATSVGQEWFYPALLPGDVSLESWRAALTDARLGGALLTSVALAVSTGVIATAVGAWAGRAIAAASGWRRAIGAAAAFIPVAAPPIAVATGLHATVLLTGLGGSLVGVLLGHLVPAVGYTTLYFIGVFAVHDRGVEDAALTLGASRFTTLVRVVLPMLRPQLADSVLLGAIVSWGQVALTLLLGGGRVRTLPVEVMDFVVAGQDRFAATGSLLLIVPPLVAFAIVRLSARNTELVLP